ncbi:MAG: HAD family hydrolase, partial [Clostridia bacterium]|nr:HAD family hydrolase [Clostridia bacterium]
EEFDGVRKSCGFDPKAAETVRKLKEKGLRVALATNPIFPRIATQKRIAWAGLSPDEFELYTTYETSRHCKPNPYYYIDILREMGVKAEECLMAGNDVSEDMIAKEIGMDVFLLTACLINKEEKDITAFPQGNFDDLLAYIENK